MYEELTDRLKNLAALEIRNAESVIDVSAEAAIRLKETAQEAADAIEFTSKAYQMMAEAYEAEVAKQSWIPVTERLPDVYEHVLVSVPGMAPHAMVQEAFRGRNGMWYSNGFRYVADEITHWMPLPPPPKMKEPFVKDIIVLDKNESEDKE